MSRNLPLVVVAVFLVVCGYVHGLRTDRWKTSPKIQTAADRLAGVPMAFGEWQGTAMEIDPQALQLGEIAGYVNRTYKNSRTGQVVSVLLVCGRPGPISVHTPDICYRGAGYEVAGSPRRRTVEPGDGLPAAEFISARLVKASPVAPSQLRIDWAWTWQGAWQAPENPRLAFAALPALYKLYVVRQLTGDEERSGEDPGIDFTKPLLRELHQSLFVNP